MKKIYVIGGGPGNSEYILPAAEKIIKQCDYIVGDRRILKSFGLERESQQLHVMGRIMESLEWIKNRTDGSTICILVSGDPLMYSLFRLVKRTFVDDDIRVIPGIGSLQAFAAKIGESMEDAKILSGHGRHLSMRQLLSDVCSHPKVFLLCDQERTPQWLAAKLVEHGFPDADMAVGSRISYEDEKIVTAKACQIQKMSFSSLCVVMIRNKGEKAWMAPIFLCDSDFIRNKTPMTREEIRWIILGKLGLKIDSILWDVGAGTGSVSVEAALKCKYGKVFAIERNAEALSVLEQNKHKYLLDNMEIIHGKASQSLQGLDTPTHVFIGGTGGELEPVLDHVRLLGKNIKIIISCVTLETLTLAYDLCRTMDGLAKPEILTINIEHSRPIGSYTMMEGGHPVTLMMTETVEEIEKY